MQHQQPQRYHWRHAQTQPSLPPRLQPCLPHALPRPQSAIHHQQVPACRAVAGRQQQQQHDVAPAPTPQLPPNLQRQEVVVDRDPQQLLGTLEATRSYAQLAAFVRSQEAAFLHTPLCVYALLHAVSLRGTLDGVSSDAPADRHGEEDDTSSSSSSSSSSSPALSPDAQRQQQEQLEMVSSGLPRRFNSCCCCPHAHSFSQPNPCQCTSPPPPKPGGGPAG
jgi:hypothetical protein